MRRNVTYILLILMCSFSAYADLKINESCAAQYQPILSSNDNYAIASFMLNSIQLSDKEYAEALIPSLIKNEVYAFKYSSRFAKECLSSGLTINKVVTKMLLLERV